MHNESELQSLLAQIDDLYDASAQLPASNEHWAQRSRMQVEIIQLCRELADLHDDAPLPYWMQDDAETAGDEPADDGSRDEADDVIQRIDDVARAASLPMYAYQTPEPGDDEEPLEAHVEIATEADDFVDDAAGLAGDDSLEDAVAWYATTAAAVPSITTDATSPLLDGPILPRG